MKEFTNKVAVITGAASGIGRGIAMHCAQEGMKVVLADIEEKALARTEEEMKTAGAGVVAVVTDVSKSSDVETLARKTLDAYGAVHLLCNNAGVGGGTSIWESTLADWEWVMGVNLWGVILGVRTFVPIMLEQDTECHIVNTASVAGLISFPGAGIYKVTKHGVVSLSETLYLELMQRKANIHVSVLCPASVKTRIMESERNRPRELQNKPSEVALNPEVDGIRQAIKQAVEEGMPPHQVADCVFQAIREKRFYILTHPEVKSRVQLRMEDILQERQPTNAFAETEVI
ncbi:MAG: SDR family NAD(P)-dependent oxidoreductase [Candidatus Hermodarchaeota archaeon]|uniref:3-oxoacyl-ACP reductase n=1 Tax=candidate division WOR_3 bacterium SM1_77 TaxID=1703778 RepID=A0A0S8JTB9_UNCW3|nr:MAG: 3-oxoacyl-ACP reductase [candidate division WOR_3 bacterium SM1_77]MDO8125147.1 SDR family NAD(P)-dependent oxidoreductase [Candidatus Hermodarchaeota archaeon]